MTLTYLSDADDKYIKLEAPEIAQYITDVLNYTGVTLEGKMACATTATVQNYNNTDVLLDTKNFYIDEEEEVLYIKPIFFGLSAFTDGIYSFTLKFIKDTSGFIAINNCFFADVSTKCKVAALMQNIVEENKCETNEKTSTIAHLLHYSLVNGSGCGCNCAEMCEVYTALKDILDNIDPQITSDCGC